MKIATDILRNTTITTEAGNFKVDAKGIVDVPNEIAKELISTNSFAIVEAEPKAVKDEAKTEEPKTEEVKTDSKKSK